MRPHLLGTQIFTVLAKLFGSVCAYISPSLISQQNNEKSKHISMLDKMFVIISVTLKESA